MVKERTIMIFPHFDNIEIINRIRKEYDPLAEKVLPHITLVFPFSSEYSNDELTEWLGTALKDIRPFQLRMSGFSKREDRFGNYLFLNVIKGKDEIINIHNILYNGILKKFYMDYPYNPHMTVGKLNTNIDMDKAFIKMEQYTNTFETVVDTISIEMIGENEESIIEVEHKLLK